MEEMLENRSDAHCDGIISVYDQAHAAGFDATGNREILLSAVPLQERRVELLGKMQRFRDQGDTLCSLADTLVCIDKRKEAEGYFNRAREIGEAHGFFSVECRSCLGLGELATKQGRTEEAVELLRNALVCVPLCEEEDTTVELNVLHIFTNVLFRTHAIDEVEPLVLRFQKAAKVDSDEGGRISFYDLHSFYKSARLHEVLCTCTQR